jgi:hypothetical protein
MAFTQDPDNGIYRIGPDVWGMAAGGVAVMDIRPARVGIAGDLYVTGVTTAIGGITLTGATNITGSVDIKGSVGSIAQAAPQHKFSISSAGPLDSAYMAFNISGAYASLLGLGTDGQWYVGGWSAGAVQYRLYHEGNSYAWTLNADKYHINSDTRNVHCGNNLYVAQGVSISGSGSIAGDLSVGGNFTCYGPTLRCGDVYATRTATAGFVGFGSNPGGYIYFDGATFNTSGGNIVCPNSASFGSAQGPKGIIDVMALPDRHFTITAQGSGGGYCAIGCINDGYTAWQNIAFQGGGSFHPAYDGAQALGNLAERWNAVYAQNGAINTSDARLKKDIVDSPLGLSFIETLRPVQYKWIAERTIVTPVQTGTKPVPETVDINGVVTPAHDEPVMGNTVTPVPGVRPHWGLIAQEVRSALVTAGFADNGIVALNEDEDVAVGLNYSEFIAPLVAAVQELSARVRTLEAAPV